MAVRAALVTSPTLGSPLYNPSFRPVDFAARPVAGGPTRANIGTVYVGAAIGGRVYSDQRDYLIEYEAESVKPYDWALELRVDLVVDIQGFPPDTDELGHLAQWFAWVPADEDIARRKALWENHRWPTESLITGRGWGENWPTGKVPLMWCKRLETSGGPPPTGLAVARKHAPMAYPRPSWSRKQAEHLLAWRTALIADTGATIDQASLGIKRDTNSSWKPDFYATHFSGDPSAEMATLVASGNYPWNSHLMGPEDDGTLHAEAFTGGPYVRPPWSGEEYDDHIADVTELLLAGFARVAYQETPTGIPNGTRSDWMRTSLWARTVGGGGAEVYNEAQVPL